MANLVLSLTHRKALTNMALLYAGKSSGVLVAFVFLPLYSRLLGAEQFGVVAVILSLQALLIMLDLGMSTLVSRDVGAAEYGQKQLLKLIHTAEIILTGFYLALLFCTALLKVVGGFSGIGFGSALAVVALFWVLILQNIYYSAMLAKRAYSIASIVQIVGVLIRAGVTAYVLSNFSADLTSFIIAQLIVAAIHCWLTRKVCRKLFSAELTGAIDDADPKFADVVALLKRAKPLVLFAAAGAAVTQLDKPIVSIFMSASSVAPYFLAITLCMTPIAILAGPVSQYFQPSLLSAVARQDTAQAYSITTRFVVVLLLVTAIPSIGFWLWRMPIIDLWMGASPNNAIIGHYVEILLPGFALGALGFIPYTFLLGAKDFKFQAVLSSAMTVTTLLLATVGAFFQSIEGVCYVYACYHASSSLLSWLRAMRVPAVKNVATMSFIFTIKNIAILCFIAIAFMALLK